MTAKQLSLDAINLLKFILTYTGEKELDDKGNEVFVSRRLNGEESAQRRFYIKNSAGVLEVQDKKIKELAEVHNNLVKAKREELAKDFEMLEGESREDFDKRLEAKVVASDEVKTSFEKTKTELEALTRELLTVEMTEKTWDVCKKYFKEFGEKVGFMEGDDKAVELLVEKL